MNVFSLHFKGNSRPLKHNKLDNFTPKFGTDEPNETLLKAVITKDSKTVQELLSSNRVTNINIKSKNEGLTPLQIAIFLKMPDMAKCLIANGADVNVTDSLGMTPLHNAVKFHFDFEDVVEALIKKGADVNQQDTFGNTPLHSAVEGSNTNNIKTLLTKGANPNLQNNIGETPLMAAMGYANSPNMINVLKPYTDLSIRNKRGMTALEKANSSIHYQNCAQYLS